MSHGQWRDVPFLQAEDSEDELLAVQDNIVLTARPDTMLAFPPLLVRALKVAIEDTNVEALPAVLNEFQAIAPRHLNPGIDAPEGVLRPARGYIWPLYNASHAWHASSCRACRADYGEGLQGDPGAHIEEYAAADAGGESSALEPWFSWDGALEHNESMVLGTLRARVHVHNFAVPEQGTLELYVQNTRAAWTDQDTSIKLSIAALNHGLHVFTARLRGRDGEWLPFSARRVAFVGARPPVHPWLLTHDIEVVGDGLSAARVGERATFRIHVSETARQDAGHARRPPARGAPEESEAQESACKGENCGDSGGGGGGGASGREDATDVTGAVSGATGQAVLLSVKELPWLTSSWTHAYRGLEHWTVELRGPAIISGRVVPNGAVAGVYEASFTVYDAGDYALSIVLHYANGHGRRNPGAGGQEDVIEYLVPGSPFLVRASASNFETCPANISRAHPHSDAHTTPGHDTPYTHEHQAEVRSPFDPTQPRRLCSGSQAVATAGRWINRRILCPCGREGRLAPGYGRQCDFADMDDDWVWAPLECALKLHSPLEAQNCLEDAGRRVLVAGASPQRTLFFDIADLVLPGDIVTSKAHQDLEFPPSAFFHWVPYHTNSVAGCPLDCQLDYNNVTWHIENFINQTSTGPGDIIVVQAGIHDIFFGSLETYFRNIPKLASLLSRLHRTRRIRVLFRIGDAIHLPRGGDVSLVEHGFRSQRMLAALEMARRVMIEAGVPILDTLQLTIGRPEGTADGYHFNEWACLEDTFRGNSISRATAHIVMHYSCDYST
eukprot:Tamp_06619.p1 GENE.Tamp_06619~~Tamp_06619.p1  ORF type:complete len:879 (-),score=111.99 Tamp_06619:33-2381(-)